jgi:SAM-dependent methyltransferase
MGQGHSFSRRQARLLDALVCPVCRRRELEIADSEILCSGCGPQGRLTVTSIDLMPGSPALTHTGDDALLRLKETVKRRFPGIYPRLIQCLAPVFVHGLASGFIDSVLPDSHFVLELGSGTGRLHPSIINVDIAPYSEVDLVCPIERLPFPDDSVDGILSIAVLEHVPNPQEAVAEMLRVLKPGGRVYCYVPFMQGIHASPNDYQRYTPRGLEVLFSGFSDRVVRVAAGPTSGFLWLLQEWVAMLLSLGSRRLYWFFYSALFIVVAPLKYLDLFLTRHPFGANIASGFAIEARKASAPNGSH